METDYGCAAIVTTAERAADLRQKPAYISGAVMGAPRRFGAALMGSYNMPDDDFASAGQRSVAQDLYRVSGRGPGDFDALMVYDHFTAMVLMSLEDFQLCPKGEGGRCVSNGAIVPGGKLAVNTSGGTSPRHTRTA
jgi:acetyl-CoA acetyltransferase